jgi:KUP system potassium uptake protein
MARVHKISAIAVLGVVFGDIGTSPLYAIQACFAGIAAPTRTEVLGVLSLIAWSLIIIVNLKYVMLVMRADNKGEGGILALMVMAQQRLPLLSPVSRIAGTLAIVGAAMFYGDSIITPAISVLSSVEGLKVLSPKLGYVVVPLAAIIVLGLFLAQRRGTERMGALFGPVMVAWFSVLALLGLTSIARDTEVLAALNPLHGLRFLFSHGMRGFLIMGAVVLAVTGAEALYADMGHFGRRAVARVWTLVVLPALLLNYLGQGALLLRQPDAAPNPFFGLVPPLLVVPMVLLASAAAVIASQAVISGAFSITQQAIQLGLLPRMRVDHTSSRSIGQIYVPFVNWALLVMVMLCVLMFQSSAELATAYGIAVTTTMIATTVLLYPVTRHLWLWPLPLCIACLAPLLLLDLTFLTSNLHKLGDGGWFPVVVGSVLVLIMLTWRRGRDLLANTIALRGKDRTDFVREISKNMPHRAAGSAVFLTRSPKFVPMALLSNLRSNLCLHECILLITVATSRTPYVDDDDRLRLEHLGAGIYGVYAAYGYMERPDVPMLLAECKRRGVPVEADGASYFMSRETVVPKGEHGLTLWRAVLFAFLARNGQPVNEFFGLPADRVVELGGLVEL